MLRATNEELRRALADNVGEPHLINKAMLAELEGLRAARSVDAAETRAIIASLTPLLEAAAESEEAN
jgi:UDP-3-O-acyl-N-acetylglucosamine deacetylase